MQVGLPLMETFGSKTTNQKNVPLKWKPPGPPSACMSLTQDCSILHMVSHLVSYVQKRNRAAETWAPRIWRGGRCCKEELRVDMHISV